MRSLQQTDRSKVPAVIGPKPRDPAREAEGVSRSNPVWQSLALRPAAIQAKLTVSQPGDPYEQEADHIADRVMRMATPRASNAKPTSTSDTSFKAQRMCAPCEEEENELQRKERGDSAGSPTNAPAIVSEALNSPGQPLDHATRGFMEPRFGQDFGQVRVHTNAKAVESAQAVNALALTVGRDLVFGEGQYQPTTPAGQRLLAHELSHVVQQAGAGPMVQRQHVPDTGFRYTLRAGITRSVAEIQGIVGTTPDGIYGEDTRRAVEKYQTKLKAEGFYSDTIDGRWGNNTETAYVAFATGPNVKRKGYNCTGFTLKDYQFHDMATTKAKYSATTKLADCSKDCTPYYHKFWYWEFDINVSDTTTGATSATWRDFHTVGGQTDKAGKEPGQVMSKDGPRPVVGPRPPLGWKPITEPVIDSDGNTVPDKQWNILSIDEECFCHDKLP